MATVLIDSTPDMTNDQVKIRARIFNTWYDWHDLNNRGLVNASFSQWVLSTWGLRISSDILEDILDVYRLEISIVDESLYTFWRLKYE